MNTDNREAQHITEPLERQRPRLLFHVSGLGHEATETMKKQGLLAHSPTLTPRLDIATYYGGGDLLTFWYPQKKEVDHGMRNTVQTPTTGLTDEMKKAMLDDLSELETDEWIKDAYKRIIDGATTYLPGDRLRAVARLGFMNPLQMILPEDPDDIVTVFSKDNEEVLPQIKGALEKMKIDFLDPSLNNDILANDIKDTYIEHGLLRIGERPGSNARQLENNLNALQSGSFDNPLYERYRTMLIARIQQLIEENNV